VRTIPLHDVEATLTLGDGLPDGAVIAPDGGFGDGPLLTPDAAGDAAPPDLFGLPATCSDHIRDGDETDVDCGGSCLLCGLGRMCQSDVDCATGSCNGFCLPLTGPPHWQTVAPMINARTGFGAALGGDGLIYAVGGAGTSVETYDAVTGHWSAAVALPDALSRLAVVSVGGVIYAIGGGDSSASQLATVYSYTPSATAWQAAPSLVDASAYVAGAAAPDGTIYVFGGLDANSVNGALQALSGGTWMRGPNLLQQRWSAAAAFGTDGLLYAIGGSYMSPATALTVETYPPGAAGWQPAIGPSVARDQASAVSAPDGRIYVVAGNNTYTVEAFQPGTSAWMQLPSLPMIGNNGGGVAAVVGDDGRIYALGGGLAPASNQAVAYGPTISLAPRSGSPGTLVAAQGSNFAANAPATFTMGGQVIAQGKTDLGGYIKFDFLVPPAISGTYRIRGVDQRSAYPVSTRFVVP
jgi:hypothetical protein